MNRRRKTVTTSRSAAISSAGPSAPRVKRTASQGAATIAAQEITTRASPAIVVTVLTTWRCSALSRRIVSTKTGMSTLDSTPPSTSS
jgi:hypothetical protein